MKKLLTPVALLFCVLFLAPGCSSTGTIVLAGIRVEITGIERAGNGTATVTWRLMNPNIVPYLISRANHKIFLNNILVGTTRDSEAMAIPAQNSASHTSRLVSAGAAADRVIAEAVGQGPVAYRIDADLFIQLFGDMIERGGISGAGSVKVTGK